MQPHHPLSTPLACVSCAVQEPAQPQPVAPPRDWGNHRQLYEQLVQPAPSGAVRQHGVQFVQHLLLERAAQPCDLPQAPEGLAHWMHAQSESATAGYASYLHSRRAGAARRYFSNRAHALHFLQSVAPTKLVDGSWLYGVLAHAGNARLQPLVRTYVEELGNGQPGKNHVVLYRQLLDQHGLALPGEDDEVDDQLYVQGLTQLALGWNAQQFLPEIVGFNLAYEQLPLHLLISAYELNELGIDPYYFTLHVTVDNRSSGHARLACDAVSQLMPRLGGTAAAAQFWRRVRAGARLADAGIGTTEVIANFDIEAEVLRIFRTKCRVGAGMHSDHCRVAGRTINDWLAVPDQVPAFLAALEGSGWIRRGEPAQASRFWGLLQGERAEMFGVFSAYELQVICDWLRGPELSADGLAYHEAPVANQPRRRPGFRALQQVAARTARAGTDTPVCTLLDDQLDTDLPLFRERLRSLHGAPRQQALVAAMSPAEHWTPTGLYATRLFLAEAGRQ